MTRCHRRDGCDKDGAPEPHIGRTNRTPVLVTSWRVKVVAGGASGPGRDI